MVDEGDTTFAGAGTYTTLPMDVTPFEKTVLHLWRGEYVGTGTSVLLKVEESTDKEEWVECFGGETFGLLEKTEETKEVDHAKRYLRLVVSLSGINAAVTLFALGHFVARTT